MAWREQEHCTGIPKYGIDKNKQDHDQVSQSAIKERRWWILNTKQSPAKAQLQS